MINDYLASNIYMNHDIDALNPNGTALSGLVKPLEGLQ